MPRGLRGEKRAIMSVWDDFIHRLEQDLAECRRDLELLESGQMQHRVAGMAARGSTQLNGTSIGRRKRLACTGV
jgi:DeoR/GlpR family transcriptional regulator of sugar metabolism